MEAHSHYTVSCIESFLNTIPMMDINVNVQNTIMIPDREFLNWRKDRRYASTHTVTARGFLVQCLIRN